MTIGAKRAAAHVEDVDPITFEVVRGKLAAITEEQAITLKSVSGSPVVTEATDFNNGLYLADGSIATMGHQVLFHTGTMSSVIRSIISDFSRGSGPGAGIHEGDMFILNDPYRGAVHQPDVSIVAPIFHDERHVAWAGSCAHQLDVGGMSFGGWAVKATEVQQEAMLLEGLRIVEGGELRDDVWRTIMAMTRLPHVVGLDLKAMIAANHTAIRRLGDVMNRYGTDVVERIMRAEIDASEAMLRTRLRELPDGTFRAVDYLEHDGHANRLYEICVAAEKRGSELIFDLTGSSPQAPGFINCTRSGLVGAIFTAMLPILAPDIRWNEGILRPVRIEVPDGVVCNARWPAPVSAGTVSSVWVATNAATMAVSRLASCGRRTRLEAPGVTKGSMWVLTLAGADRDGGPFGTFLLDSTVGGGGAYLDHDGLDASGEYPVPRPAVANVETNEAAGPYLYLYRRLVCDTGGPGRTRGGVASELAIAPHDVDHLNAMLIGHGVEVPNSTGVWGGMEAGCNQGVLRRGQAGETAPIGRVFDGDSIRGLGGDVVVLGAKPGHFKLRAGDVLAYGFQGGGGYGDPIVRHPESVRRDVDDGWVSVATAAGVYGVVLAGGLVDETATKRRRLEIRRGRLDGLEITAQPDAQPPKAGEGDIAGVLVLEASGDLRCRCGQRLGPADQDWKGALCTKTVEPATHGPRIRLHDELELREHACRACGTLLESEVARRGAPGLRSIELHLGAERHPSEGERS